MPPNAAALPLCHRLFIANSPRCNRSRCYSKSMKCDLHVHTIHSGDCTVPGLRKFCRECYSPPQEVYRHLRRRGMDLVTVTDHDSIAAAGELGGRSCFFCSEEVTCTLPSGTAAHLAVYDINENQHLGIQRRRNDWPRLMAYVREQQLFCAVNHIGSALTGSRRLEDFATLLEAGALEVRNGHIPGINNRLAERLASHRGALALSGSDAHTLQGAGRTWTRVPGARTREEFLRGLRAGHGRVEGEHGSYATLTAAVWRTAVSCLRESHRAWPLLPLLPLIPAITLAQSGLEYGWAAFWNNRLRGQLAPSVSGTIDSRLLNEEAA